MPLYAYRCPKCSRLFEDVRTVADRNRLPVCPECETKMARAIDVEHGTPRRASCGEVISRNACCQPWEVQRMNASLAGAHIDAYHDARGVLHANGRDNMIKAWHHKGMHNLEETRSR